MISIRDRSEKELREKLGKKNYQMAEIENAVEKLKMYNYINDEKFAEQFVKSRISSGRSRVLIKSELKKFGIDDALISSVLEKSMPAYDEEVKMAIALAKKKLKKGSPPEKILSRIIGFLARRGFSWDVISAVLRKIKPDIYSNGDDI